jgi:regulator of nonsense transcripts 3
LTESDYLGPLSDRVRDTVFLDAKGSASDSALLGPPAVEFATFGRVPNPKPRKDARQGTIDQDPEFIDFLESLTNPVSKPTPVEVDEKDAKGEKTTPLIQYLRDKKANKVKEATAAKVAKHNRQDSKEVKSAPTIEKKVVIKSNKEGPVEKRSAPAVRAEKAPRDAVKGQAKQPGTPAKPTASSSAASEAAAAQQSTPAPPKKRERGNISAAARILQRDLGIGANAGGRRRRETAVSTAAVSATGASSTKEGLHAAPNASSDVTTPHAPATAPPTTTTTASSTQPPVAIVNLPPVQPPAGPAGSSPAAKTSGQTPNQRAAATSKTAEPAPTSTQAFLKHANPSQGITEPLLQEAFAQFGTITKVEIDKKKGFAYIDFEVGEGLRKAMAASPVKIAQGQVVVLERKIGPSLQARNARGGPAASGRYGGGAPTPRGGRGGSVRGRGGGGRGAGHAAAKAAGGGAPNASGGVGGTAGSKATELATHSPSMPAVPT